MSQPSSPWGSSWTETFGYDEQLRLKTLSAPAGGFAFGYNGPGGLLKSLAVGSIAVTNQFDAIGNLKVTHLRDAAGALLNSHAYDYDAHGRRTNAWRTDNTRLQFGYDGIGQLRNAVGYEPGSATVRKHENFSYIYDRAGNLSNRMSGALSQTFGVDNLNQLATITRNQALTVAGTLTAPGSVTINGQAAEVYSDLSYASASGLGLIDGNNTFTSVATGAGGGQATKAVTAFLPSSISFAYDQNENLTSDGIYGYDWDDANQLIRITQTNAWKSEFKYDGLGRRRTRTEYTWNPGAGNWNTPGVETRYLYFGREVIQERDGANNPLVAYTLGGTRLSRTDLISTNIYVLDGNQNVTALVTLAGSVVGRYVYDSFGRLLAKSGTMADANLYRFSSKMNLTRQP